MLFGEVLAIALSAVGFLASLQGLWLVSTALWPARVAAAGRRAERSMLACFFAGLAVVIVLAIVIRLGARAGAVGQVSAAILGLVFLVYSSVGTAGFVSLIGRRLASPVDRDRPWKATIRGGVVLQLACIFPVLGWFGVLPIALVIGAGAVTLGFFGRKPTPASAEPPVARVPPPVLQPVAKAENGHELELTGSVR